MADIAVADRFGNEAGKTTAGGQTEQAPNVRWSPKDEQPKLTVE